MFYFSPFSPFLFNSCGVAAYHIRPNGESLWFESGRESYILFKDIWEKKNSFYSILFEFILFAFNIYKNKMNFLVLFIPFQQNSWDTGFIHNLNDMNSLIHKFHTFSMFLLWSVVGIYKVKLQHNKLWMNKLVHYSHTTLGSLY